MAISRYSPEWQRVTAMAAMAGVKLRRVNMIVKGLPGRRWMCHVYMPLPHHDFIAKSMYDGGVRALRKLGVDEKFLPDAATPRTARSGPERNRTEEFTC